LHPMEQLQTGHQQHTLISQDNSVPIRL
jgi:hypothetical protein